MKTVNIGIIGFGTVGSGVAQYLIKNSAELRKKTAIYFKVLKIAEINRHKVPSEYKALLAKDADDIINDPAIDVVIELIGGVSLAKRYISAALKNNKHVITANKALLAQEGDALFKLAAEKRLMLKFEAAVGGGIPVVRSLSESLIANDFESILGIVNGTSNYILTLMEDRNISMKEALKIAQKKGYAEKNPSLDLEGVDSSHKLAILIRLAFGYSPKFSSIYREGITQISELDIKYAIALGYRIKLLAIAKKKSVDSLEVRVHPTLLPLNHLLSSVRGVFNAIYLKGNLLGELVFYGQGAGKMPTTSAIISDLVYIAQFLGDKDIYQKQYSNLKIKGLKSIKNISSRYYIRFMAVDMPGVLAKISGILGKYNISIASVSQKERGRARSVPIIMMTHEANEMSMKKALDKIYELDAIKHKPVYIRVEG